MAQVTQNTPLSSPFNVPDMIDILSNACPKSPTVPIVGFDDGRQQVPLAKTPVKNAIQPIKLKMKPSIAKKVAKKHGSGTKSSIRSVYPWLRVESEDTSYVSCQFCPMVLPNLRLCKLHEGNQHPDDLVPVPCLVCRDRFRSHRFLKRHLMSHHNVAVRYDIKN